MVKRIFIGSLLIGYVGVLLAAGMLPVLVNDAFAIDSPNIQVNIGSFTNQSFSKNAATCEVGGNCPIDWIGEYISAVYSYGIGITGVLAAVMITAGGFLWLTSAGSPERVGRAKEFITSALSGLAIALFSFIILYSVNPALTKFRVIGLSVPNPTADVINPSRNGRLGSSPSSYYTHDVIRYVANNEGFSATRYEDPPGSGRYSIGHGHQITGNENPPIGDVITAERAQQLFVEDMSSSITAAQNFVGSDVWASLTPDRRMVLVDMAYNLGEGGLNGFTQMQQAVVSGNWSNAFSEVLSSQYAQQVPNRAWRNATILLSGTSETLREYRY